MGITKTTAFSQETNQMAEILKALGHPARLEIVKYLISYPACICGDIVEVIPLAQSTISRHLSELKRVGIIKGSVTGNNICYCLNEEVWEEIRNFINILHIQRADNCC